MRLIQVLVPSDDHETVRETLSEMEVEFVFSDADGHRDGSLAYVPVPTGTVDAILDRLYDAGLDEDTYTVVTDVDRANVSNVDELRERYVEGPKGERGVSNTELRERAEDLTPDTTTYLAFAIASVIVAVGGLLLDSAIVIVGAMVIAPFAGSTLSASVGAVAMSVFLQQSGFVPATLDVGRIGQVGAFVTPNLLTLVIAISAGFAGALALAADLPVSIAGVAVAAAIVPAASVAGIGTAWGQPLVVAGAIVLLLMNIVFINLTTYLTLIVLGYRSSVINNVRENADISLRSGAYAIIIVLFLVVVAVTAFGTYQHIVFEQRVNDEVQDVLGGGEYSTLELANVETEYNDVSVFSDEVTVTVTVGRSSDLEYERLAEELQDGISNETGRSVQVDVRFVDYQRASTVGDTGDEPNPWWPIDESSPWWPIDESSPWWPIDEWLPLSASPSVAQSLPQAVALPADLVEGRADPA